MRLSYPVRTVLAAVLLFFAPNFALASYLGPGLGLGFIATAVGIIGAVFLGLASILWYPVKRLLRRMMPARPKPAKDQTNAVQN